MNWEQWLRNAAQRPSDHEDSKRETTEQQIRDALRNYGPLKGRKYRVYAKGSYANNTNVRLNYDVDIAVEYYGFFFEDLCFDLKGQPSSVVGNVDTLDTYTVAEFKADVRAALETAFGKTAIKVGKIAYRVRERKTTLPADVVPCFELRRYDRIVSRRPIWHQGSRIFPSGDSYIDNFPQQQLDNGNDKNKPTRTNRRYKRMVRCLKKLQTLLVDEELLDKELPSYLVECLVYNVPDGGFGNSTYKDDMRYVLMTIFNETLPAGDWNDWHEVNELKYLLRSNREWTRAQVHKLADVAWDYMGFD
jgi:hypothetical protein